MGALDGSWAKLERAKRHVDDLRGEIRKAGDDKPYIIDLRSEYHPDTRSVVFYAERLPKIPDDCGLIIGDAIHNFRCALDHLWWQLAIKHLGREPTDKEAGAIQFPIFSTDKWEGHRYLSHINPTDAALVKPFQPYRPRYDLEGVNPLEVLADLSNTDKHRTIPVVVIRPHETTFEIPGADDMSDCVPTETDGSTMLEVIPPGRPVTEGDEVLRVFVFPTGPNPQVDLKADFACEIALGGDMNVLTTLDAIGEWVIGLLDRFEPVV